MYVFMWAGVLVIGFPIVYAFLGSFKTSQEFLTAGANLLPKEWHWQNYVDAWMLADFKTYTFNSIAVACGSVLITLISTTMTGYVLARVNFVGKKLLMALFAAMLFVAGTVTLFPTFLMARNLGLTSSLWGMIITLTAGAQPINSILVMNYVQGIPKELDESGRIDGCGFFRIFFSIILPIVKPIIATVGILEFRAAWNNYMIPLAFTLSSPKLRTLTVGVVMLKDQGEGISSWNLMIAGTVISLLPILIVYLFFNKWFIAGMTEGAVKG